MTDFCNSYQAEKDPLLTCNPESDGKFRHTNTHNPFPLQHNAEALTPLS